MIVLKSSHRYFFRSEHWVVAPENDAPLFGGVNLLSEFAIVHGRNPNVLLRLEPHLRRIVYFILYESRINLGLLADIDGIKAHIIWLPPGCFWGPYPGLIFLARALLPSAKNQRVRLAISAIFLGVTCLNLGSLIVVLILLALVLKVSEFQIWWVNLLNIAKMIF